ncbi:hypothetical protein [Hymenobacter sp. GOD-10R]|uniref:hypothetical protein n=1 Tax=Hymenobacter sp. GOD-10R TaxID=3093922 RepID=UPI002D79615C|nr:hypothetical protein [Hymenobacter sp. GOD-10R]WRQ26721.1 hypothetical protein SD425_16735 [Hymenobacter sp. GOD-10R]
MKLFCILFINSLIVLSTSCQTLPGLGHQRTVTVTETTDYYQLVATYPASSYPRVAQYMRAHLAGAPNRPSYAIWTAPGRLRLTFNKQTHSASAAAHVRQLGRELTAVVTTDR